MSTRLAQRVENIQGSQSVLFSAKIAQMRSRGEKIISLNVGESDHPTPPEIIQATIDALKDNQTRYSLVEGLYELREKIASKINEKNKHLGFAPKINPENIILGSGSKHIIHGILQILIDPGDEVIIPAPYWVTFPEAVKISGGHPVIVPTQENFQLDLSAITRSISEKTKCIIINTPNNPTGAIYPKKDLEALLELAKKYDFYIISDEAYELMNYTKNDFISPLFFSKEAFNHVFSVRSFSKTYGMTGFRIGYTMANEKLISAINKLHGHTIGNNCTFAQFGAIRALEMEQAQLDKIILDLRERRDILCERLLKHFPHFYPPEGAFYCFFPISHFTGPQFKNCTDICNALLEEKKIAILPGIHFGLENHIRVCFTATKNDLIEASKRMDDFFTSIDTNQDNF